MYSGITSELKIKKMSELPLSKAQALKAVKWLKENFGTEIENAVKETPFSVDNICGIACQETAYRWINWIDKHDTATILARCVFDATGSVPGTDGQRKAFPVNLQAFEDKYGKEFADMLVAEGNKMRELMGWEPRNYLYVGLGIFQYDLQAVLTDEIFFRNKLWYNFSDCLDRCLKELNSKYAIQQNVSESIRAYNGAGQAARNYRDNVLQFTEWAQTV